MRVFNCLRCVRNGLRTVASVLTFGLVRRRRVAAYDPLTAPTQAEACLVHVDGAFEDTRARPSDGCPPRALHGVLVLG